MCYFNGSKMSECLPAAHALLHSTMYVDGRDRSDERRPSGQHVHVSMCFMEWDQR